MTADVVAPVERDQRAFRSGDCRGSRGEVAILVVERGAGRGAPCGPEAPCRCGRPRTAACRRDLVPDDCRGAVVRGARHCRPRDDGASVCGDSSANATRISPAQTQLTSTGQRLSATTRSSVSISARSRGMLPRDLGLARDRERHVAIAGGASALFAKPSLEIPVGGLQRDRVGGGELSRRARLGGNTEELEAQAGRPVNRTEATRKEIGRGGDPGMRPILHQTGDPRATSARSDTERSNRPAASRGSLLRVALPVGRSGARKESAGRISATKQD